MIEPLSPSTGWGVLHLFCRMGTSTDQEAVIAAAKGFADPDHQLVTCAMLGYKADVGFMALGPDLWRLQRLQARLRGAGLILAASYVSLTEVSEYASGMPEEKKRERLYPRLPPPGKAAFCFYPMSKRRTVGQNWYELPYDQRKELMAGHGSVGRTFAGRVVQLITGSTGLDDYEWGVTLFGQRPDDLKEVVYSMRFDRASATFAEFGPFFAGMVGELGEILARLGPG